MQALLTLVSVSLVLKPVYTAVAIQPPVEKPPELACQEGCYSPELNIVLPYNITYSPRDGESCKGYLCNYDNYTQIFTCGVIGLGPGCVSIPGDLYLPYPDCCDSANCPPSPPNTPTPSSNKPSSGSKATATATATASSSA